MNRSSTVLASTATPSGASALFVVARAPAFLLPFLISAGRRPMGSFFGADGDPLGLPMLSIILLVVVSVSLVVRASIGVGGSIRSGSAPWLMLALLAYLGFSVFWSEDLVEGAVKFAQLLVAAGIAFAAAASFRDDGDVQAFAWGFLGLAGTLAVVALFQPASWFMGRAAALGGGPNVFGRFMVSGLFATWYLHRGTRGRGALHGGLILSGVLFALMIVLTGSRGVFLSTLVVLGLSPWLLGWRPVRAARLVRAALLATVVVSVVAWAATALSSDQLLTRLVGFSTVGDLDTFSGGRVSMLRESLAHVIRHPLSGIGLASFGLRSDFPYPHNWFVELAVEGGVIALVLGTLFCLVASRDAARALVRAPAGSVLLVQLFAFSVLAAQFSGDLFDGRLIFVYGLALGALSSAPRVHP